MGIKLYRLIMILLPVGLAGYGQGPVILSVSQPAPLEASAGPNAQIRKGESVTIGGSPAAQNGYGNYVYLWTPAAGLDDPTQANPTATPSTTTTYQLTVTDANHCSAMDQVTISVDASGMQTIPSRPEIRCYPNPFDQDLVVEINGLTSDMSIRVLSPVGKELIIKTIRANGTALRERINMRELPAGLYILQVIDPVTAVHQTIIKTR